MTHDKVIRKVKQLYALVRSAGEHEALAATKAAERLIQEYRLSEAELHGPETAAEQIARGVLCEGGIREIWRRALANVLAQRYSCAIIWDGGVVRAFGSQSDLEILRLQYDRISSLVQHTGTRASAGRGRGYADSFRKGMASAIIKRIIETVPASQSTAIVRLDQRAEAAAAALNQEFPNAIQIRPSAQRLNSEAVARGREAGRNVHLGESMGPAVRGALGDGS